VEFAFAHYWLDRAHHCWSAVEHDPLSDFERELARNVTSGDDFFAAAQLIAIGDGSHATGNDTGGTDSLRLWFPRLIHFGAGSAQRGTILAPE
jgi:hypothetical protein